MLGTVTWAIMNVFIVAAVWVGIVLVRRQRRLDDQQAKLEQELAWREEQLGLMNERVAQLEERLDLSERMLQQDRHEAIRPERMDH